jgi:pimeloyl-ACP methyl ester carboxylesterase
MGAALPAVRAGRIAYGFVMTLVLVHGGSFAASCWDFLLPHLDVPAVAVDLPGRGSRARPLEGLTIADSVDAVIEDIESRDLHDVVLVGHSMAGITMPGVAERIPDRLAHLVFVACTVPADGESTVDTLDPEIQALARKNALRPEGGMMDDAMATAMFCNDMDDEQIRATLSRMVPEAVHLTLAPVSLAGLRRDVPRTWVRTERDLIVPPARQDLFAQRTGSTVVSIDAAHMAMISRPAALARVLMDLATASLNAAP